VVVQAPAKVNLSLRVGPLGPDGYHELVSVFHAVSLYEEVSAAPASPGSGITLSLRSGSGASGGAGGALGVPLDASNLAVRAAALLAARTEVAPDVHLTLRKNAPVAGGMAGGSAAVANTQW
jgi:4-diphosphocytidyl-2-C-methyl-D-erythritol kinase